MDEFIIWAAGLFDGEGCVAINQPAYELQVSIANSYKAAIELFKERYSGTITITGRPGQTILEGKYTRKLTSYQFYFDFNGAKAFLSLALPYLRIKRAEAQVALDYISTISNLANLRGGRLAGKKILGIEKEARKDFALQLKAIRANKSINIPLERYIVPQGKLFDN